MLFVSQVRFEYRLRITLGPKGELMLTSRIINTDTDGKPFTFTFAHHNYLSVSNIRSLTKNKNGKMTYGAYADIDSLQKETSLRTLEVE
nr:putative glucose-6-phosphate 1-epimerase [Tanacetum cinerariifolium]